MICDFHAHTSLSDGELSPMELIRRALVNGYRSIALTDHAGVGYLERLIAEVAADCRLAQTHWRITAITGVELTHLPAAAIAAAASRAKELGAKIVVVHGETTAEPVEPGTNLAAVSSPDVDILAHPGFITLEEARLASANGVFLEITARKQHATTNRHVAEMARAAGTRLILDSDAHDEQDLLTEALASTIARSANLDEEETINMLETSPAALLRKLALR